MKIANQSRRLRLPPNDATRLKLSLTKERSRFAPPVSDDKMIEFAKGMKCVNTDRSTNHSLNTPIAQLLGYRSIQGVDEAYHLVANVDFPF